MSSPFFRRSAVVAGATVLAGLVASPIAAFASTSDTPATPDAVPSAFPADSVTATLDVDGTGTVFTLKHDVTVDTSIQMPANATLDGADHTITAVEDATSPNFPGAVVNSTPGTDAAPGHLDIKNLHITTADFTGSNSNGALAGIAMYRTSGSISHVTVNGISHGNGVQEGNGIAIRNSVNPLDQVQKNDTNVPRATVSVDHVRVTHYQKTGLLFDGNLTFTADHVRVGQASGPAGQLNDGIASNSLQISRGASGTVSHASVATNGIFAKGTDSDTPGTGAYLYNAKNVTFYKVNVEGSTDAEVGLAVENYSNNVDTNFTMNGGKVVSTAIPADGTGVQVDGPSGSIHATLIGTNVSGWTTPTDGDVAQVAPSNVSGSYRLSHPAPHRVRIDMSANKIEAGQVEGKALNWTIKVDGHRATQFSQHAGDHGVWAQGFRKSTGTHTVQIIKNGVSQKTVKVHTS